MGVEEEETGWDLRAALHPSQCLETVKTRLVGQQS